MEREIKRVRYRKVEDLRKLVEECLIQHSDRRAIAMTTQNLYAVFYEQGWMDALRTIRDAISEEGLLLFRYKNGDEERERASDVDVQ